MSLTEKQEWLLLQFYKGFSYKKENGVHKIFQDSMSSTPFEWSDFLELWNNGYISSYGDFLFGNYTVTLSKKGNEKGKELIEKNNETILEEEINNQIKENINKNYPNPYEASSYSEGFKDGINWFKKIINKKKIWE